MSRYRKRVPCATAGKPCERVHSCGDGAVDANEGCDDGNNVDGDGCSRRCRFENGFKCTGNPSVCTATVCGDGVKEGAESCDDSNKIPFDGCSATCQTEPEMPRLQRVFLDKCGDGILLGAGEQCDDGNYATATVAPTPARSNRLHLHSATCMLAANGQCTMTYRRLSRLTIGAAPANPDFEPAAENQLAIVGSVVSAWRPIASRSRHPTSGNGYIHSAASFAQRSTIRHRTQLPLARAECALEQPTGVGKLRQPIVARGASSGLPTHVAWCANGDPGQPATTSPAAR